MEPQEKAQPQALKKETVIEKIERFKESLQANPNDQITKLNLGVCYTSIKEFDKAIELLNALLEQDPKNSDALNALGVVLTQLGKLDQAVTKFEIAVKLKPEKVTYWNNLSEAYRRIGNYHKANVSRMRAIQLIENK